MANRGFDGTTITFGGSAIARVTDIGFTDNGNPVDITSLDDAVHKFVNGIPSMELTVTVVGVSTIVRGNTGAIVITWNDGTSQTGGSNTFLCTNHEESGSLDDKITTALTFAPYGG